MDNSSLQERQIQALEGIAEAMTTVLTRDDVLEAMLKDVVDKLGYRAASVRLLDAEHSTLTLQAAYGLSPEYLAKGPVDPARSRVDQDVLQGESSQLKDVTQDACFQYPQAAAREGIRSILAVPLKLSGRVIGVLHVYTAEEHTFSRPEQRFLAAVAQFIARAIATAQLFYGFRSIAHQVNSSLKLDEVLAHLLQSTIGELNLKAGLIRLLDAEHQVMRLVASVGLSKEYLGKGDIRVGESAIDREALQGKAVTIYDVTTDPRFQYGKAAAKEQIRSAQAVPLAVRGTVIGVLRVYSARAHRFSDEEVAFLQAAADLGALAIENARLYEATQQRVEDLRQDNAGWYRFLTFG